MRSLVVAALLLVFAALLFAAPSGAAAQIPTAQEPAGQTRAAPMHGVQTSADGARAGRAPADEAQAGQTPADELPADPLQATLRQLEQALLEGIRRQDRAALDALLAADFVMRGTPDVAREAWLDNAVALCWGDRSDVGDFRVRPLAQEVATVSFALTTHQDPVSCEPAIVHSFVTSVWVREGRQQDVPQAGTWRLSERRSGPAGAGDAVTQQFRREDPPPPALEGKAELSFVSTGGNTSAQTLGTAGELIWRAAAWKTEAKAVFVRAETEGVESARSLAAQVRESRAISSRLDLFARGGFLRDVFAGVDARVTLDAGLGWLAVDRAPHTLRLDGGLGYLDERRLAGDDLRSAIVQTVAAYKWAFSDTTQLTNDAALLMPLEDTGDWRYANRLAISAGLSRAFSVKLSHALSYLHAPVPGFRKTDRVISAALVATFAR